METSGGSTRRVKPVSGPSAGKQDAAMAAERMLVAVIENDAGIDHDVMAAGTVARENPDQLHAKGLSGCLLGSASSAAIVTLA